MHTLLSKNTLALSLAIILFSCENRQSMSKNKKWYDDTKAEILNQSNLNADSIVLNKDQDSIWIVNSFYSNGQEFKRRAFKKEWLRGGTYYYFSKDNNFELRQEICDNNTILFEGIVYKGHFYGLSTWWSYCDKKLLSEQGVRFKDEKISVWKKWDESGKATLTDYGNQNKLDSMPSIK